MKLQKLFLALLILSFFFSVSSVQAQSKSEQEQKQKIQELEKKLEEALRMKEVDLEKALKESKQIQKAELEKILENQKKIQQKAREHMEKEREYEGQEYLKAEDIYKKNWESWEDQTRLLNKKYSDTRYHIVEPEDWNVDLDVAPFRALSLPNVYFSSGERTALTIKKELNDVTFDTKFKYEVTEGANGINFKVDGRMNKGTLLIRLTKPNGDVLQEIEISPLADISWNQDLRWDTEEEQNNNKGSWLIVVSAKNASGDYTVNVRAN